MSAIAFVESKSSETASNTTVKYRPEITRPSLSDRVSALLSQADWYVAQTGTERDAVFRLRYDAYRREGAIAEQPNGLFTDPLDEAANALILAVTIDGALASSIRLHVARSPADELPALSVFARELAPELAAGRTIVDPTRFVADRRLSRLYPELPYITVRLAWMLAEHIGAPHLLATVRQEHQAFYRRVFGHRELAPARPYPSLAKAISLMSVNAAAAAPSVYARYPFFRSTAFERRTLFAGLDRAASASAAGIAA
jgi:hypothetical protein